MAGETAHVLLLLVSWVTHHHQDPICQPGEVKHTRQEYQLLFKLLMKIQVSCLHFVNISSRPTLTPTPPSLKE